MQTRPKKNSKLFTFFIFFYKTKLHLRIKSKSISLELGEWTFTLTLVRKWLWSLCILSVGHRKAVWSARAGWGKKKRKREREWERGEEVGTCEGSLTLVALVNFGIHFLADSPRAREQRVYKSEWGGERGKGGGRKKSRRERERHIAGGNCGETWITNRCGACKRAKFRRERRRYELCAL